MTIWKSRIAVGAIAAVTLIAAIGTADAQTYKHRTKRHPVAEEEYYRAPRADNYSGESTYDYFFNNPGKYRGIRSNRGEYYEGAIRR